MGAPSALTPHSCPTATIAAVSGAQAATARVKIDGIPVTAVIDSGSAVTLISASLFRSINVMEARVVRPWTRGPIQSANGSYSLPTGTTDVHVSLGPIAVKHSAVVFEGLPFHTILGVDFLAEHGVVVDVPAQVLRFAREPDVTLDLQVGEPVFTVCTVSRCIIPALSEALLPVSVPVRIPHGYVAVVEPPLQACAVLVARGVCGDTLHNVLVANPTPTEVTLENSTIVGRLTLLPEEHAVINGTSTLSTVVPHTASKMAPFLPPEFDLSEAKRTLTRQQLRQLHAGLADTRMYGRPTRPELPLSA